MNGSAKDPSFIPNHLNDLCASLEGHIVDVLLRKLAKAGRTLDVPRIAISGGVSANSSIRDGVQALATREGWTCFIPPFAYCTDNAAMIAMAGHFLFAEKRFAELDTVPVTRF
jgi:N6-L-threonylcarbamoyladenine synthase